MERHSDISAPLYVFIATDEEKFDGVVLAFEDPSPDLCEPPLFAETNAYGRVRLQIDRWRLLIGYRDEVSAARETWPCQTTVD